MADARMRPTDSQHDSRPALLAAQDKASWFALQCEALHCERREMQARIDLLEESIAFGLGSALLRARTVRGLLALPGELVALARRALRPGRLDAPVPAPGNAATATELLARPAARPGLESPGQLRELRVAAVLDEFTHAGFAPECDLHNLPSEGFEHVLDQLQPHFLLVESAWRGHAGTWRGKLHPSSAHLRYLADCCRRRGIPTVFWNKEDPVHFEHFAGTAALFDHVFTTDSTCIPRYRERLGSDRIGLLPFSCQPRLQNPVETARREAAACFAGSWYCAYPERARDFESIVDAVERLMPVVIYDRNAGRGDPSFVFPARFASMSRGRLEYDQIDKAYKGFRYAIAMNTVKDSPTMLSRRVYELLACNTITISNATIGVATQMGDLVVVDEGKAIERALALFEGSIDARRRFRLRGLRRVLREHTAAHRLHQVAMAVLGQAGETPQASINVVARARTPAHLHAILSAFRNQSWPDKRLFLVTDLEDASLQAGDAHACLVDSRRAAGMPVPGLPGDGWLALFHPADYYGPEYLADLALATLYEPDGPIGKDCHFRADGHGGVTRSSGDPYRRGAALSSRAAIVPHRMFGDVTLLDALSRMEAEADPAWTGLAVDEFGYCRDASAGVASLVDVPA